MEESRCPNTMVPDYLIFSKVPCPAAAGAAPDALLSAGFDASPPQAAKLNAAKQARLKGLSAVNFISCSYVVVVILHKPAAAAKKPPRLDGIYPSLTYFI